jgi:PucR family transcriptional regulator, purine catabolism regulatory protein
VVFPTVADVLALDPVRRGEPTVCAGARGLDRRVRWAHVSELADIAGLLRGGELILTTGVALPSDDAELAGYVADLDNVGVAGLFVELGRRYASSLPPALVRAAEGRGLPLVALASQTRFVAITEAVHERVVDAQLDELRASEEVHETFTELSVEGAEPAEIVRQAARMSGRPVVLENLTHQVLAYDAGGTDVADLLSGWESRSRGVTTAGRTGHDPRTGWLVTTVGARGHDWGRLVLVCGRETGPRDTILVERAASTLALNRLVERDRESLERQTHRTLLAGILAHTWPTAEVALRARALGVPLEGRQLVAVVLRPANARAEAVLEAEQTLRDLGETAAAAVRESRQFALVGAVDDGSVGVLLSVPGRDRVDSAVEALADALGRLAGADEPVMAVGSTVDGVPAVRRSFLEATHVADAAANQPARPFHRLEDVRLRGLLHLLRDDARLQTFVEREVGPLLAYDADHRTDLVGLLRTYLGQGRNKSSAADAAHLSRPAFYERLHRIERVLDADLDDVESCLSLHVALVALDAVRR